MNSDSDQPDNVGKPKPALRFFNPAAEIKKCGDRLPHWEQPGVCYFITFRLADSLPAEAVRKWQLERDTWVAPHPKPWDKETETEYHRQFSTKIEQWLDQGSGLCLLKKPAVRDIILNQMRQRQGEGQYLHALVIMPNHVHALVSVSGISLPELMKLWKGSSAYLANQHLGRSGPLWQRDYFDRIIRDQTQFNRCLRYIANNPGKASLRPTHFTHWTPDAR